MSEPVEASERWGVPGVVPVVAGVLAVGAVVWALTAGQPEDRIVAGAAAVLLFIVGLAAARFTERLRADERGLRIRTLRGVRSYTWPELTDVRATGRSRPGRRRGGASVDIDLADDTLMVFGRWELGSDPVEVTEALRARWLAATGRS